MGISINNIKIKNKSDNYGFPDKNYFYNNNYDKTIIKKYKLEDVINDDNCGYRELALQIYKNEENHSII